MRIGVVVAIGLHASLGHADVAQDKAKLVAEGERHERAARTVTTSTAEYVACGQAYVAAFNLEPEAGDAAELLYNAGVCFEQGHSFGIALNMYERLDRDFPRSPLKPKALGRLARAYDQLAMLPRAAELFERYATAHAGERDARDALSEAVAIRRAYGDDDKLIADVRLFLRSYAKDPRTASEASYAMTEAYRRKGPAELERHLREWLRMFSGADRELHARATLELAESIWKRACPVPGTDGLCVKLERPRVLPLATKPAKATPAAKRCTPVATPLVAIARDPRLVAEATTLLQGLDKLPPSPAIAALQARAHLLLADRLFESYAAVRFPTGLDFSPERRAKEASTKRFGEFVQLRTKLGGDAQQAYLAVVALKDPATTIAAGVRLGWLPQAFAHELTGAEIPQDVRTGEYAKEKVEAFCDKMTETAEPLLQQAIDAFDLCISKASQLGVRDANSRACARERAALGPTTFPLASELLPEAPLALPVVDEEPPRTLPAPLSGALAQLRAVPAHTTLLADKCLPLAQKFADVAKQTRSADAWFAAGLTYGRCQREALAKAAYDAALAIDPKHGKSISNLGALAFRAGQLDIAKARWEAALAVDAKLFGAQLGLASLLLQNYRAAAAAARRKLRSDIEYRAQSAAAVGTSSLPYVQLGILALLDGKPGIAKYLADRAELIEATPHVRLLKAAITGGETAALPHLEAAVTGPWQEPEARLALAFQQLALGRHDDAAKTLAPIPPSYDAWIARGINARGLGKLAEAEAAYASASKLDPARAEAHFNLGVLLKDHVAARAADPAAAKAAFKKAAEAFRRANTPEAKLLADDCDKAAALR